MIRTIDAHDVVVGECKYYEFAGLSTDTKPTEGVATGSVFVEVNTGDVYMFNEEGASGSKWVKVGD